MWREDVSRAFDGSECRVHNISPLPFFGVIEGVLETAGPPGYVGVIRVVVSLTNDVDAPKAKIIIHVGLALPLDVHAVETAVIALHDLNKNENLRLCFKWYFSIIFKELFLAA